MLHDRSLSPLRVGNWMCYDSFLSLSSGSPNQLLQLTLLEV